MRKVCRYGREILDIAGRAAKPGVTTDYIDEIVHNATIERDVSMVAAEIYCKCTNRSSRIHRPSTTATFPNRFARRSTRSSATASPISEYSKMVTF